MNALRTITLSLLLFGACACVLFANEPDSQRIPACKGIYRDALKVTESFKGVPPSRARREGTSLTLMDSKGKEIARFVDKDGCSGERTWDIYQLESYDPAINYFLVRDIYAMDAYQMIFINGQTGFQKILGGTPVISPDRKRFFVERQEPGPDSGELRIYSFYVGGFKEESALTPATWFPGGAQWRDASTITYTETPLENPGKSQPGFIQFKSGQGWKTDKPLPDDSAYEGPVTPPPAKARPRTVAPK
jgi:hypothetical protein